MIVKPSLTEDQCHPEEGVYSMVTEDIWRTHMMDDGIIEDDYQLRKVTMKIFSYDVCVNVFYSQSLVKLKYVSRSVFFKLN